MATNSVGNLDEIRVDVKGLKETVRTMRQLSRSAQRKLVRRAGYHGATMIRDSARARVPKRTRALEKKLVVKSPKAPPGTIRFSIGVERGPAAARYAKKLTPGRLGKKGQIVPARYAHIPEFGSSRSKATPFFRPAIDENREKIVPAMAEKLRADLHDEVRKLRAGHG